MIDVNSWLPVPDYPNYEIMIITNTIKSLNYIRTWNERLLKWYITKKWYIIFWLSNNWKARTIWIHTIVARIKYGYWTPEWLEVCHNDWNPTNNHYNNLRYWTHKENVKDTIIHWNHNTKWKFWKYNHSSKKIIQYSKYWELIMEWENSYEVHRKCWISPSNIWECCRWKRKSAWWYIWKYKIQS